MAGVPGGGAGAFQPAFQTLLASIESEAKLSFLGRVAVRRQLVRNLSNAMRIEAALHDDVDVAQQTVERPLFILGFPRTGSTLIHRLLALLPDARAPLMWELLWPVPHPKSNSRREDSRVAGAEELIRSLRWLAPHIEEIHPFDPRGAEECFHLLENTFMCTSVPFYLNVPSYTSWLLGADMTHAYQRYRSQLQLLQRVNPGRRWVLKWPGHLQNLELLFEIFPDICVIQTHRNLIDVAPSSCSYSTHLQRLYTDEVDVPGMGKKWMSESRDFLDRALSARERLGSGQFFDLRYQDLVADPIGCVRRICDRFDMKLTVDAEERMRELLRADSGRLKGGTHRYTLEQFGLERESVLTEFADYHTRFVGTADPDRGLAAGRA